MFDVGYNMYADESARSLAHLISIVGPAVGDRQKFDRVLDTFIEFVARSEHRDATAYPAAVEDYLATVGSENRSIFRFALLPSSTWFTELVAERDSGLHLDTLDPAVPTIIAVCRAFTSILGPIQLVHDHSAVIARHAELLVNADQLPDLATAGGRPGPGPVGVRRVEFGNSHQIAQLKVADWAAGAARDAAMSKLTPPKKSVNPELDALVEDWLAAPPLWPDQDWLTDRLDMGNVTQ